MNKSYSITFLEIYGFMNIVNLDSRNEFTFEVFSALLKRDSSKFYKNCERGSLKIIYNDVLSLIRK